MDQSDPGGGGGGGLPAAVAETHVGVVFFLGDRAYKLKKPVELGFLDFRDRAARLAACRREVELNRRLAPDVYLGVADVHGVDGKVCDHLVVMRRMPPDRRLAALVEAGEDVAPALRAVAALLADFHAMAEAPPRAAEVATAAALAGLWADNVAAMRPFDGTVLPAGSVDAVAALAERYLAGRQPLFDARIAAGRARDGHGDLLADDIFVLDDGPRVLDCLEFDDDLRYGDVLADAAFLAMDLERLGRPDLAELFLEAYRRRSGGDWPPSLAHHHVAYRASVRAKVACLRSAQGGPGAGAQAAALVELCRRHLELGRVRLVLVGGLPGTGKSTVATGVADGIDGVVLRSDVVRKELLGLAPTDRATAPVGAGAYSPERTAATYGALLERAGRLLGDGRTVVLDATWSDPAWRERARALAAGAAADLVELRCVLDPAEAAERIARRAAAGGDASDATPEVAAALAASAAPWPEATPIDTAGTVADVVAAARRAVGAPVPG